MISQEGIRISKNWDRKNKRKLITEDYATKDELSILEDLRVQRADLQAKLDIAKEEEEALMAELVQAVAAECGDPEPPQKCEQIPGRAGITSSSLASLFAARETHVEEFFEFASARERLRENLDNGASGVEAYAGVSSGYADLFSRNLVHNADRSADPTTKGFLD